MSGGQGPNDPWRFPEARARAIANHTLALRRDLTARQELFCLYLVGIAKGVPTEAARMAGFSSKYPGAMARKLMDSPKVQARLKVLMPLVAGVTDFSKESLLQQLQLIITNPLSKPMERIAAIKTVAAIEGLYAPTRSVRTTVHAMSTERPYAELIRTLQEYRNELTVEQKELLRKRLHGDMALIVEALDLLGEPVLAQALPAGPDSAIEVTPKAPDGGRGTTEH